MLQKVGQNLEAVSLFDLLDQRLNWEQSADGDDQVLDKVFLALDIKEGPDHLRSLGRVDLLHISFNIPEGRMNACTLSQLASGSATDIIVKRKGEKQKPNPLASISGLVSALGPT